MTKSNDQRFPPGSTPELVAASPPSIVWSDEVIDCLMSGPGWRLERIVSRGDVTPAGQWYDQETDEWVFLASGGARLTVELADEMTTWPLSPGDYCYLPAHCRHRVEWTDPAQETTWIALHRWQHGAP